MKQELKTKQKGMVRCCCGSLMMEYEDGRFECLDCSNRESEFAIEIIDAFKDIKKIIDKLPIGIRQQVDKK